MPLKLGEQRLVSKRQFCRQQRQPVPAGVDFVQMCLAVLSIRGPSPSQCRFRCHWFWYFRPTRFLPWSVSEVSCFQNASALLSLQLVLLGVSLV